MQAGQGRAGLSLPCIFPAQTQRSSREIPRLAAGCGRHIPAVLQLRPPRTPKFNKTPKLPLNRPHHPPPPQPQPRRLPGAARRQHRRRRPGAAASAPPKLLPGPPPRRLLLAHRVGEPGHGPRGPAALGAGPGAVFGAGRGGREAEQGGREGGGRARRGAAAAGFAQRRGGEGRGEGQGRGGAGLGKGGGGRSRGEIPRALRRPRAAAA